MLWILGVAGRCNIVMLLVFDLFPFSFFLFPLSSYSEKEMGFPYLTSLPSFSVVSCLLLTYFSPAEGTGYRVGVGVMYFCCILFLRGSFFCLKKLDRRVVFELA